jgi:lipid-binding SYLF domain-containing protein
VNYMRAAASVAVAMFILLSVPAFAQDSFHADAKAALQKPYESEPVAKSIGEKANAILVFPSIVKAGFIVGGQYGEGVLLMNGKLIAHYNSVAASLKDDVYAFIFNQKGLMAGLGIQGSKITKLEK